jgi:hypothetical protein
VPAGQKSAFRAVVSQRVAAMNRVAGSSRLARAGGAGYGRAE